MAAITGELKQTVNFTQILKVDGVNAIHLNASINSSDPTNYTMSNVIVNQVLYQANRDALNESKAAFEDVVWAMQETMVQALAQEAEVAKEQVAEAAES